jgi:hypothetical protein
MQLLLSTLLSNNFYFNVKGIAYLSIISKLCIISIINGILPDMAFNAQRKQHCESISAIIEALEHEAKLLLCFGPVATTL